MPTRIDGSADLQRLAGQAVGVTEWTAMTYERIAAFAAATGDFQWIHVDRERIAKESPYKVPIAHGYLTLSLVAGLFFEALSLEGFKLVINYGTNKVRFPTPLREGDRYRLALRIGEVKPIGEWWEVVFLASIEVDGQPKPACAAECVYRFLPA